MKYDTTLKQIFQTPPQRLLQLLIGEEAAELLTVEFPSVKKRFPDLVVLLISGAILHLELQSDSDDVMEWRMLEYYSLIRQLYPNAEIIQRVLYVGPGTPKFKTKIDEGGIHFEYQVVNIIDIDCREMLASPQLEENLLAVLCRMEDDRKTIREVLTRIETLPSKERADALEKLMILAGLRKLEPIIKEEVDKMAISVNVMENEFLRDLFVSGEQKGRVEGKVEGKTELLQRLLHKKFGNVPAWADEKLKTADAKNLEVWGDRILDASSIDDVFKP
ncbi:DUF4351 domain-containing protein [Magnetococcales bacterium HHB-1]